MKRTILSFLGLFLFAAVPAARAEQPPDGNWSATLGVAFSMTPPDVFAGSVAKATGLPAGLKYNAVTRTVAGVPTKAGTYAVTLSATGAVAQRFTLRVTALPAWAQGAFSGYVEGAGSATMVVSAAGKIAGKISAAGTNYAFSAISFAAGGSEEAGFRVETVAKAGRAALPLTLDVKHASSPESLGVAAGLLGGALPVALYRDVWKSEAGTLAPPTGYYTSTLPGDFEFGSGFLTFTVDKTGKVKTAGMLADGTAVSLSGTVVLDDAGRVFVVVYTAPAAYKGGSLFGLAEIVDPVDGQACLRPLDDWPLVWKSHSPMATGLYGEGFVRPVELAGGWYDTVINLRSHYANGLQVGDIAVPELPALVKYTDLDDNDRKVSWTETEYVEPAWDASPAGLALSLNAAGTGFVLPKADKPVRDAEMDEYDYAADTNGDGAFNTSGLTFTFTRATGIFKGSFTAWYDYTSAEDWTKDTEKSAHTSVKVTFQGALTPVREDASDVIEGAGYFLWPDVSSYENASGKTLTYKVNGSHDFTVQAPDALPE